MIIICDHTIFKYVFKFVFCIDVFYVQTLLLKLFTALKMPFS